MPRRIRGRVAARALPTKDRPIPGLQRQTTLLPSSDGKGRELGQKAGSLSVGGESPSRGLKSLVGASATLPAGVVREEPEARHIDVSPPPAKASPEPVRLKGVVRDEPETAVLPGGFSPGLSDLMLPSRTLPNGEPGERAESAHLPSTPSRGITVPESAHLPPTIDLFPWTVTRRMLTARLRPGVLRSG